MQATVTRFDDILKDVLRDAVEDAENVREGILLQDRVVRPWLRLAREAIPVNAVALRDEDEERVENGCRRAFLTVDGDHLRRRCFLPSRREIDHHSARRTHAAPARR